ncbi:GTP cyclohydrolase I [Thomasclavelia spiroformis]|uniref:GTP cyclohydrolase I n=1 Tax=Thomasclavelia spiroformis TaxID=29348 RepID=UPI0009FD38DF
MEEHIYEIIKALNDNPNCEDLKETSKRVAKIYKEVFMSMNYTNEQIAKIVLLYDFIF